MLIHRLSRSGRSLLSLTRKGHPVNLFRQSSSEEVDPVSSINMESILQDHAFRAFSQRCEARYNVKRPVVEAITKLVESGSTVPFIVRYRSFSIGGMEPADVFAINRDITSFASVCRSRTLKLERLKLKDKLTPAIVARFNECVTAQELDEAWSPFKEAKGSVLQQLLDVNGLEQLTNEVLLNKRRSFNSIPMGSECKMSFPDAIIYTLADRIRYDSTSVQLATNALRRHVLLSVSKKTTKGESSSKGGAEGGHSSSSSSASKYADYEALENRPLTALRSNQVGIPFVRASRLALIF